ncbi:helix-turn-helix domain-containing protein [Rossellomorea marisflavi]|uniref:helix-turn-helix domain-containing protein n=1 Tax=Rossellomorea marisflavi TaxID=189381 RepID=UPI003D2933F3
MQVYVGKKIRQARRSKDLTLYQLSEMTGISLNYLASIEKGRSNPTLNKLFIISKCLDIPLGELLPEKV